MRVPGKSDQHLRFEYMDALRGFAILGVVFCHAGDLVDVTGRLGRWASMSALGVQLFFVVSAFTIFLTLDRASKNETHPVQNFFVKRLFRIVPPYWLWIGINTAIYGLGSRGWREGPELWHYPLHFTLTNLFHPHVTSSVVPGGWSISCEVIFYLTVPIWFRLVRTIRSALVFLVACLVLGPLAIKALRPIVDPLFFPETDLREYWFRCIFSQIGIFAFGILLYFCVRDGFSAKFKKTSANLVLLGMGGLVLYGSYRSAFLPRHVVASAGFFLIGLALSQVPWRALVNPATTFVGRVSYSFYFVHFLVLNQLRLNLPEFDSKPLALALLFALSLVIGVPLSYLGFRFVEEPCSRLAKQLIAKRRVQELQPGAVAKPGASRI